MQITFTNPPVLFLLFSLPLLVLTHLFTMVYMKRRAFKFANLEAIWRVTGGDPMSFRNTVFITQNLPILLIRLAVVSALIFAGAGTTIWIEKTQAKADVIIAIDASASMLANDFTPSRIGAAKLEANNFIDNLDSDTRIGVISFSGNTFIEQDITSDKKKVKDAISKIEIKPAGGTNLADAIITSSNMLINSQTTLEKTRTIILITDGQSTVGPPIEEGVDYAKKNSVTVNAIGVATEAGGKFSRVEAISKLDIQSLSYIADSTSGKFFEAQSATNLSSSFKNIIQLGVQKSPTPLTQPMLLVGLGLIFLEWGLISTKFRSVP